MGNAALRAARLARGVSPRELADMVGVSIHTVYRWERGTRVPHQRMQRKVARRLRVGVDALGFTLYTPAPAPQLAVGQQAPDTLYIDRAGVISTVPPEVGQLLIAKGDTVTENVARVLNGRPRS